MGVDKSVQEIFNECYDQTNKALTVIEQVPSADATANTSVAQVVGAKDDTANETAGTTSSLMRYLKGVLAILGTRATAAATGAVGTTTTLVAYVKQLVTAILAIQNKSGVTGYNQATDSLEAISDKLGVSLAADVSADQELILARHRLVLWMPLTTGTGTSEPDLSGLANTGTITAGTGGAWPTDGLGYTFAAAALDANCTVVAVTTTGALNIAGPITILLWFKPADWVQHHMLVAKVTSGDTAYPYQFRWLQSGGASGAIQLLHGDTADRTVVTHTPADVPAGTWKFLACTRDATNGNIYVNGVLGQATALAQVPRLNTRNVTIGANTWAPNAATGQIAGVRIYRMGLSANAIARIFAEERTLFGV